MSKYVRNDQYGINFIMRPEVCVEHTEQRHTYLVQGKGEEKRSFINDDKRHRNVLIEGENYHALKILGYTHAGKIDVIYVDPPYNTGNNDFVYNDDFAEEALDDEDGSEKPNYVDSEDPYRHSKWLSFMHRRLILARELLSERGVIFMSIDDNEFAQLKLLCDGIFGEKNFVANLIWQKKKHPGNDSKNIATVHEYVLMYAKNIDDFRANREMQNLEDDTTYRLEDQYVTKRGRHKTVQLDNGCIRYGESLDYGITAPDGTTIFPGGSPKQGNGVHTWRWSQTKVNWGLKNGFIIFKKMSDRWKVYYKQYQFVNNKDELIERSTVYNSFILDYPADNSDLKAVFEGAVPFSYAKPVALITYLLRIGSQKDSVILDFFAGSGTTGQAAAELNKEDGGTRQFILVTNNDKSDKLPQGISRQVTFPRLLQTMGEENLVSFRVEKRKKGGKSRFNNVEYLLDENKLLPMLKLQYNTFNVVENGEEKDGSKYSILTDHEGKFFLGVWDGGIGGIGRHEKRFKNKLNSYGKKNELLSCEFSFDDDEETYPCRYYDFMNR